MKTGLPLAALLIFFSAVSGCSKFRELTRRDYAQLRDPFLDRSAVTNETAADDASENRSSSGTSGIVRIDDLNSAKPRNTAAAANAAGPAGQNFAGVRVRGMGDAISTDAEPSRAESMGARPDRVGANTTASAQSQPSQGMAGFTAFLENQAEASGLTETAHELDKDFSEWAVAKKDEWQKQKTAVAGNAAPVVNPMRQVSQAATSSATPEMPTLSALAYGRKPAEQETATPLIHQTAAQVGTRDVPSAVAAETVRPSVGSQNPFAAEAAPQIRPSTNSKPATHPPASPRPTPPKPAISDPAEPGSDQWNPFAAFERQSSSIQKSASAASPGGQSTAEGATGKTLDTGFLFDSGWRPSNLQRP